MDVINHNVIRTVSLRQVDKNTFTAAYQGKIFSIGEMLYFALNRLKENIQIEQIATTLSQQYNIVISRDQLNGFIENFLTKVENREKNSSTLYSYVYFQLKLMGENSIQAVTRVLSPFFNRFAFFTILPTTIVATVMFLGYLVTNEQLFAANTVKDTAIGFILSYVGLVSLAMFHEFGHAAAAEHYGEPSDSIGFGFYLIFPVFFTDVTKIWNLNKWQRIVVNVAGVYFQFISNLVLIGLYFLFESPEIKMVCKSFFVANVVYTVYSLNPFLRNDGYWVYSDLFNIPNLTARARNYPKEFWQEIIWNGQLSVWQKVQQTFRDLPLLIYSVLYLLIMSVMIIALIYLTFINGKNMWLFFESTNEQGWSYVQNEWRGLLKLLFGLTINIYFITFIAKQWIKKKFAGGL